VQALYDLRPADAEPKQKPPPPGLTSPGCMNAKPVRAFNEGRHIGEPAVQIAANFNREGEFP